MINWKKYAVQLAKLVGSYERSHEREIREKAAELAAGIMVLYDLDEKKKDFTPDFTHEGDALFDDEYLEIVRLQNDTARRLDKDGGK